jgi:hypothetical protein
MQEILMQRTREARHPVVHVELNVAELGRLLPFGREDQSQGAEHRCECSYVCVAKCGREDPPLPTMVGPSSREEAAAERVGEKAGDERGRAILLHVRHGDVVERTRVVRLRVCPSSGNDKAQV